MNYDSEEYNFSIFETGYPKRIYYDPNNNIIGLHPSRLEFFKIVNSSSEEKILVIQT